MNLIFVQYINIEHYKLLILNKGVELRNKVKLLSKIYIRLKKGMVSLINTERPSSFLF